MPVDYFFIHRAEVDDHLLQDCSTLFAESYGIWGPKGSLPDRKVAMKIAGLRSQFLVNDDCFVIIAVDRSSGQHIGQAICAYFSVNRELGIERVLWITQLVVDKSFRRQGIATELCKTACVHYNADSFGIVSSNPYAIRSLQKACGLHLSISITMQLGPKILKSCPLPYIANAIPMFDEMRCVVDTKFYINHDEVDSFVIEYARGWPLGLLQEGEEFIVIFDRRPESVIEALRPAFVEPVIQEMEVELVVEEVKEEEHAAATVIKNGEEQSIPPPLHQTSDEHKPLTKRLSSHSLLIGGTVLVAFATAAFYPTAILEWLKHL